ncbi:MAG TPA: hypothetical protein VJU86_13135 [Pyrinomonadaceae bacterium]|nr:hypothetical protein [Pyrinomonadaceae bacterium]
MKWLGLVLACLVVVLIDAGSVYAQSATLKPNLSGKWLLEAHSQEGTGAIPLSPTTTLQLEISDTSPVIKINRIVTTSGSTETTEYTYYSDGRGEKNPDVGFLSRPGEKAAVEVKSETKWKKHKLVVVGSFRQRLGAGKLEEVLQLEEWELAADGKTLTQIVTRRFEDRAFDVQAGGRTPPVIIATRPLRFKRIYKRVG